MTESQQSPAKRSAVERLNDENMQLRQQLTSVQQQKLQLQKQIKRQESQIKIYETKYSALEKQLQKVKTQNHRYIEAYEKEKKQRLELINNQQSVLNNLSRDGVELNKFTNENILLREQVETLEKSLEQQKTDRVSALRDKQNNTNKIKLLETKLQAATNENKYAKIKENELQNENNRLKEQLVEKEKLLAENQTPLQVQTIYKQSNQTTEKLFLEFENKMKEKEMKMVREIENYEKKHSALLVRISELETQLLSLRK